MGSQNSLSLSLSVQSASFFHPLTEAHIRHCQATKSGLETGRHYSVRGDVKRAFFSRQREKTMSASQPWRNCVDIIKIQKHGMGGENKGQSVGRKWWWRNHQNGDAEEIRQKRGEIGEEKIVLQLLLQPHSLHIRYYVLHEWEREREGEIKSAYINVQCVCGNYKPEAKW